MLVAQQLFPFGAPEHARAAGPHSRLNAVDRICHAVEPPGNGYVTANDDLQAGYAPVEFPASAFEAGVGWLPTGIVTGG